MSVINVICPECGNKDEYIGIIIADNDKLTIAAVSNNYVEHKCEKCNAIFQVTEPMLEVQ